MTTLLIYDDSVRSYELRHEVGEVVNDPFIFAEHEGRRIVVVGSFERDIFERREDVVDEVMVYEDLGIEELVTDPSFPLHLSGAEIAVRLAERLGVRTVAVPPSLAVQTADHLRGRGLELEIDPDFWASRRRHKTPWELEGIERAQRAAELAMNTAARMLREAEPTNEGRLRFEGEILTAELIRIAMQTELLTQGCESEDILVQGGDACLSTHDLGTGPLLPDQTVIIDCFPRERRTGVYSDMTRTFLVGDANADIARVHGDVRAALDIAYEALRPGRDDAFAKVCDYFESKGYPTQRTHSGGGVMAQGFLHSLGHGVGLQVHEHPRLGRRADVLVEGDVVAVEPGLYFPGVGGVRLEDTVMVTDRGPEFFTEPFSYDLTP